VLLGATAIGVQFARDADTAKLALPAPAIRSAAALSGTRRLFCEDFAWCSLALAHPNLRTFVDGRCDPFPLDVWNAYLAIERTSAGWRASLARFGIDTILASRHRPLANALAAEGDWRVVWRDERYVLFARE